MTLDGAKRGRIGFVAAALAVLAAVAHSHALGGFFLRDDLLGLLRASRFSASDLLSRWLDAFGGPGSERANGLGYVHFWVLWRLFGMHYVLWALGDLVLHAASTALVVLLAWRLGGDLVLAALAGTLFAIGGGAWEIAWISAVQHQYVALAVAGIALGQLAFGRRPRWTSVAVVVGCALIATTSVESGAVAAMTPLVVESCLRRWLASDGPPVAGPGARFVLALAAAGIGAIRLVHYLTPAMLSGATAVGRYAISLAPWSILDHLAAIAGRALLLPSWLASTLVVVVIAVGAADRVTRLPTICGAALALLTALPVATIKGFIDVRLALIPSVGLSIALAGGAIALSARVRPRHRRVFRVIAMATGVVALVHFGIGIRERARRDVASARAERAVASELPRLLAQRGRCDLVVYGLPEHPWQIATAGSVEHPDIPVMMHFAVPLFIGRDRLASVWVVDARLGHEVDVEDVRFVGAPPRNANMDLCAFRFDGEDFMPCDGAGCLARRGFRRRGSP